MEALSNFNIMCSHDIYEAIEFIHKQIQIPSQTSYRENHIFDEDQTVRWNKEEVARRNAELKAEKDRAYALRNDSLNNLDAEVVEYIQKYVVSVPKLIATKALRLAQQQHEDDWWNWVEDYAEFAADVIETYMRGQE